jgi:hypothetical protein
MRGFCRMPGLAGRLNRQGLPIILAALDEPAARRSAALKRAYLGSRAGTEMLTMRHLPPSAGLLQFCRHTVALGDVADG